MAAHTFAAVTAQALEEFIAEIYRSGGGKRLELAAWIGCGGQLSALLLGSLGRAAAGSVGAAPTAAQHQRQASHAGTKQPKLHRTVPAHDSPCS